MNMADQNWVGSAIWLTTKLRAESLLLAITVECQLVLPISTFTIKDSFVLGMYTCTYVHNLCWLETTDQSTICPTNIILGQPFILANVKINAISSTAYVYTMGHGCYMQVQVCIDKPLIVCIVNIAWSA